MSILKTAFEELMGMFIDDGALASLSLVLIVAVVIGAKTGYVSGLVAALILLVGSLLILAESVSRAARTKFRTKN
ncbi:hypothetical protein [Rhizobium sp. BK376]|uniref:hypothetical protein n=1 Tax=Rhizobium sp. BK376 TaxID=2512149 RepID=UPI0010CEABD0|nr:hypothetical protein [Rhizobium sp. BK376]TCR85258.1 hypothetical protein EV561_10729 [Rhizobium sp. BK376]